MSEQGAQGGTADQANQNNQQGQTDQTAAAKGTEGAAQVQGSDGAGQAPQGEGQQLVAKGQTFLIQEFHALIRSALYKKVEEVCEHAYLDAKGAIEAVVEGIKEEAARLGWGVSDNTAHAFASAALLDHKLDAQDHQAVTPPPSEQEPAPPPDHPPPE